jgi:hypothetical protein
VTAAADVGAVADDGGMEEPWEVARRRQEAIG